MRDKENDSYALFSGRGIGILSLDLPSASSTRGNVPSDNQFPITNFQVRFGVRCAVAELSLGNSYHVAGSPSTHRVFSLFP